MQLSTITSLFLFSTLSFGKTYKAVIYTGFAAYCDDGLTAHSSCWDAAGFLLKNSTLSWDISFFDHDQMLKADLSGIDLYIQPGGGDDTTPYNDVWADVAPLKNKIQSYVAGGGRYIGFCQGAYLAGVFGTNDKGENRGYDMFPKQVGVDEETTVRSSPVYNNYNDTIININYTLADGSCLDNHPVFFQDGSYVFVQNSQDSSNELQVLGSYSVTGDYAISLSTYGKGVVGASGPHIEADPSWFGAGIPDPNDPNNYYQVGLDFLQTVMTATPSSINPKADSCGPAK